MIVVNYIIFEVQGVFWTEHKIIDNKLQPFEFTHKEFNLI